MKRLLFGFALCAGMALVAADGVSTNGVRNPFWPMGYEGVRESITSGVRERPKPAPPPKTAGKPARPAPALTAAERAARAAAAKAEKEAAEKAAREKAEREAAARAEAERKKREITGAHWEAARAALKFGGRVKLREEDVLQNTSVVINGKVYADGDLVSFTHNSRRFTWRVEGLTERNTLKLVRIRAKYIEKTGEAGTKSDKGVKP